ncbi:MULTISPECIES: amidase family protein [unclassified Bradyrhizobium]|uniref:amidase family protein n=1 Tax=unclassified Bradyrhizobium TaxID=2631580 RepID=UPI003395C063
MSKHSGRRRYCAWKDSDHRARHVAPRTTTNPFDPLRTPGGSSSGSAAMIGPAMVPAAIGTQLVGSVTARSRPTRGA